MTGWDIATAAAALASGDTSPVELTEHALARIEALDGTIDAFARVCPDHALRQARRATAEIRSGVDRGHLHGIPFAAKDLYDTAGIETNAGSRVLAGRVPDTDASCISLLDAAGAVLLGKTRTHEFAYGVTTPPTRNPTDLDRTAGGSSGGSGAAVAAGYCPFALGTDTGGSLRIPASLCGVVGLRPTFGLVDTKGAFPLAWSLDTAGPVSLTVRDAACVIGVLADPRAPAPTSAAGRVDYLVDLERGVAGLVLGVPRDYFFDRLDPYVEAVVRTAISTLESAGATLRELDLPHTEHAVAAMFAICLPEAVEAHAGLFPERSELYGEDVRRYLELGSLRPGTEYVRAQRVRSAIVDSWRAALASCDAILAPSLPAVAALVDQQAFDLPGGAEGVVPAYLRFNAPASLTGLPSLSVPCATPSDGLPVGLQIVGRPFGEGTILRIGRAYEQASESHRPRLDERLSPSLAAIPKERAS